MSTAKQKRPNEQRFAITFPSVPVQTLHAAPKAYFAFRSVDYHFGQDYKFIFFRIQRARDAITARQAAHQLCRFEDLEKAASTPVAFADSVRALVQAYDLNGFDIDFESTKVKPAAILTLAQEIRRSLKKIPSTRPMIMTITPDQTDGLNKDVLEQFTYVMPQTYGHASKCFSFDDANLLAQQLRSYERIVYGLNSEGYSGDPDPEKTPDDPKISADEAKMPRHRACLESPTGPPNFFSALCGNRVGFPGDEVQALCDEILPPLLLMGEAHSLEASHF